MGMRSGEEGGDRVWCKVESTHGVTHRPVGARVWGTSRQDNVDNMKLPTSPTPVCIATAVWDHAKL